MKAIRLPLPFCLILVCAAGYSQTGSLVSDQVHAVSLERNLLGDSPDRSVNVYLPPGYEKQTKVRYPVVYLLHGFNFAVGNKSWVGLGGYGKWNIRESLDRLIAGGKIRPVIIVMPDNSNKYGGSQYTNSVTTGNWEEFITVDLVKYIDAKYRTLPNVASRGIAGHSSGGYGAIKLAMKHPEIYGAVYGMSACCLNWRTDNSRDKVWDDVLVLKTMEELDKLGSTSPARQRIASAAAWSPNPAKPPFFVDFPYRDENGSRLMVEAVYARWSANYPAAMADQYRTNLMKLSAIAFDIGTQDALLQINRELSDVLKRNQIQHIFEEYEGNHTNKVPERVESYMLPFFSRTLEFSSKAAITKSK